MKFDDYIPMYVSIPVEEYDRIHDICRDEDITISEYILRAILYYKSRDEVSCENASEGAQKAF